MKLNTKLAVFISLLIIVAAGCEKEKPASLSCLSGSNPLINYTDKKDNASLPLTPISPVVQEEATPSFSFVAIGDNGCDCPAEQKIADRMLDLYSKHPYSLVLRLGDNIYGKGGNKGGDPKLFPDRFDKYYKVLEDKGVKFHAALGNHDMEDNKGIYEIEDMGRFGILGEKGYYTYTPNIKAGEKPLVAFFALNSNRMVEGKKDGEQVTWLNRALSESDAIWKIAFFHHPLYSPYGGHKPDIGFRSAIEDILIRENIQVTLAGHNHYYARMKPQKGIIHLSPVEEEQDSENPSPMTTLCAIRSPTTFFIWKFTQMRSAFGQYLLKERLLIRELLRKKLFFILSHRIRNKCNSQTK